MAEHTQGIAQQELRLPALASRVVWIAWMGLAVLVLLLLDLVLGSVPIPLAAIIKILTGQGSENIAWLKIIQNIRVPKAFTAILAGAALSVSGLQMQTLFRNPLAGPSVLGITSGASLGVAILMLGSGHVTTSFAIRQLGIGGSWLIVVASSTGSAVVMLAVIGLSLRIRDNVILLIMGLMLSNLILAIISVWQYFSEPEQIQEYLMWTFGSLGGVSREQLTVLSLTIAVGIALTFVSSKFLNLLLLGEGYAGSMGINLRQVKLLIIISTSLLAGAITGFCGPIAFIGIAVPHLCRAGLNTADHRVLIPSCCLLGAAVMLLCDIVAQLPGHQGVLPVNAVTAMVGSPVVMWVILKRKNIKSSFS
jgi:iron complex transport system permease protein